MGPGPFFGICIEIICYMGVIRIVNYLEDEGGLVRRLVTHITPLVTLVVPIKY